MQKADSKTNNTNNADEIKNQKRVKRQELTIALTVCGLIIISSFLLGNYFLFDQQETQVTAKRKTLSEIQASNNLLHQIADNRIELDKETNRIDEGYKVLAPLVPEKKELPAILDKIQRNAIDRGLRLENFVSKPSLNKQGALSEIPINIELTGDDEQIRLYISSLNYLERILHVNNLKTTKIESGQYQGNIKVQLEISAYISNIQNSELNKTTKK